MEKTGNERLKAVMRAKGIGFTELSALTGIPDTTLRRFAEGSVKRIRYERMRKVADALHVPVDAIFEVPSDTLTITPIPMQEAGEIVTRTLTKDESLLLYWYQQLPSETKRDILYSVNREYIKNQRMLEQKSYQILSDKDILKDGPGAFEQIEMFEGSSDTAN